MTPGEVINEVLISSPRESLSAASSQPTGEDASTPEREGNSTPPPRTNITMNQLCDMCRTLALGPLVLPEYAGQEHEDPEAFLWDCEEFSRRQGTSDSQQVPTVERALEKAAVKWWSAYKNSPMTWGKFSNFCEITSTVSHW